jgi:ferrochelatase
VSGGRPPFGVLLTNLGSPTAPTPRAVRAYLREFLADRRVVDLPRLRWWLIRQLVILPLRPRRSARLYRAIWTAEGSPLTVTTGRIGAALGPALAAAGLAAPVHIAMRYGSPSIADGLRRLTDAGASRILVLPLYPQYSTTTTASTVDAVVAAAGRLGPAVETRTVESYHDHPAYIRALAASVAERWDEDRPADRLLVSFHGIPRRIADAGDPYPEQCAATTRALARSLDLAPGRWHMAYQSRFGRETWLRPALVDRLASWGRRGLDGVDVVCPGFAADCLETLEEVAIGGRRLFESAGGSGFRYIAALNDRPDHVAALAAVVADHTRDWRSDPPRSTTETE